MEKTKKNKYYKKVILSLVVIITILLILIMNSKKEIQLTQLQANSHRQMMGYIIKDSKGKVIVIDGGTSEDEHNLEKNIRENTKMICLNLPNNPTGTTLDHEEMQQLIQICKKHDLYFH